MILILSVEYDHSTNNVIEWLIYYDKAFKRINYEDSLNFEIKLNNKFSENILILNQTEGINLNKIKSYWYRRGDFKFIEVKVEGKNSTINAINRYYRSSYEDIVQYFHSYLNRQVNPINNYSDNSINKLTELTIAKGGFKNRY